MIGQLSGHQDFARLRAEGSRSGHGPIRLVSRPDATQDARIAFAIPRTVGNAVARNRIRRRIRAILRDLHQENPAIPPRGDHLIRITAPLADWPHAKLRHTMFALMSPSPRSSEATEAQSE